MTDAATVSRRVHGTVTGACGAGRAGRTVRVDSGDAASGAAGGPDGFGVLAIVVTTQNTSALRVCSRGMFAEHEDQTQILPTGVVLAATPLGNAADASPRLAQALAAADVIAAEDTRRTRALAAALGVEISGRVVSNFDHNEDSRARELLDASDYLSDLVLRHQARQLRAGARPDYHIDPRELTERDRAALRDSFRVIKSLQNALASKYPVQAV